MKMSVFQKVFYGAARLPPTSLKVRTGRWQRADHRRYDPTRRASNGVKLGLEKRFQLRDDEFYPSLRRRIFIIVIKKISP